MGSAILGCEGREDLTFEEGVKLHGALWSSDLAVKVKNVSAK